MRSKAEMLISVGVVIAILHFAMNPLVVILISILLSFMLEPIAGILQKIRLPRALAVFLSELLFFGALSGIVYLSYSQFNSFVRDIPGYSEKVRELAANARRQVESIEKQTEQALPTADPKRKPVEVKPVSKWTDVFEPVTKASEILLYASFVPFLVYFMLTWREHAMNATVRLFKESDRASAYDSLKEMGQMIRRFLIGNVLVGLFIGTASIPVFGLLGLPHFYIIAYLSGYLSLVPYLGIVLAMLPPLIAGVQQLHSGGFLVISVSVAVLHLIALNVLYPKFLGRSLELNPFASVIGLLLWGWIWGAMGLVLAIPIMAALKIVCDHIQPLRPYAVWLGINEAAPPSGRV